MERCTKKVDGVWTALCKYGNSPYPVVTQEIIDRLAAYEDTGFTPEEVQIQKEAMESMGWFGKMFQRYKGDPIQSENVDSRNTGVCGLIKETGKTPKEENKDD